MTRNLWQMSIVILAASVFAGCTWFVKSSKLSTTCSFEQAWSVALASVNEFPLDKADDIRGTIETSWRTTQASSKAGVMQRDINRERVRFVIDVKSHGQGASVAVRQLREAWSPMGARSRDWHRVPPHQGEEARLAKRVGEKLKDKGC